MTWYVYMLSNVDDTTLYTGISNDPWKRLRQHNGELKGGAACTRAGRPWHVVTYQTYETKSPALRREIVIKSWTREKKLRYVEENAKRLPAQNKPKRKSKSK